MTAENMQEETRTWTDEMSVAGSELKSTIERLAKDVTVHKIVVKAPNGDQLFEVPALAGVAATLLLGPYILIALGASIIAQFKIEIVRREVLEPTSDNEEIQISVEEVVENFEPDVAPPAAKPKAAPKAKAKAKPAAKATASADGEDIKKLHGVGPANAKALKAAGLATFADIAAAKPAALKAALEAEGISRLANYETWPKQAKFAAAGQWDKFEKYQEELKAK